MPPELKTIEVKVDKSHLLTLGERMYVESIELLRELVNNAYDADATRVEVKIEPDQIIIEDNGSGMNEKGLIQFFTVGSEEKRINSVSPRFGRKRIGQFGIGKFAALSAADQFIVKTNKGKWSYSVIFDKNEWQKSEVWELPIKKEFPSPFEKSGTKVILKKLKRNFRLTDIERYLKESVPLRAKKFSVFLNNKKITAGFIPGRRFPISYKTIYGLIEGEIIVALRPKAIAKPGVECKIRQVLVKREFFGLDKKHPYGLNRISGEINADFLPIVSARDDFIRDSNEFKIFYQIMRHQLKKVLAELKKESELKNLKRIKVELKEILQKIRSALKLHPELTPSGRTILARRQKKEELSVTIASRAKRHKSEKTKPNEKNNQKEKLVLPKAQVIRRIRINKLGLSVALTSLGKDGPEVISEDNLIYLNGNHPLYQYFYQRKDLFELHLLRLITQEVILMKRLRINAQEAFSWQSKLLTDAIGNKRARR